MLGSDYDPERVRFLNLQDCKNEIEEGLAMIAELQARMAQDTRVPLPLSALRIAVKCGGSDSYSGITANPLVGRAADRFVGTGAAILMSEIPEVFGAEQLLLSHSVNRSVFDRAAGGNIAGGITTLEEKSLGCVQKAGRVPLCDALDWGEVPDGGGLYLVNGPGNDMVAKTALAASGAHMILFTTGRGTPLCAPVRATSQFSRTA